MTIEEIRKNKPDGAEFYYLNKFELRYYKIQDGKPKKWKHYRYISSSIDIDLLKPLH